MPLGAAISIINRAHFIILNERLKEFGLSAGQFPVLMCLIRKQNVMQDTLVRHFHIDKGSVARSVKKLEDAGFVRRIIDPDNRRAVRLFLTEKGEQVAPEIIKIEKDWQEQAYASLSEEDRVQFTLLISQMAKNSLAGIHCCGAGGDEEF
jgi:MarR family transcriptional regulator, temperature-dependent positive regulator of motility